MELLGSSKDQAIQAGLSAVDATPEDLTLAKPFYDEISLTANVFSTDRHGTGIELISGTAAVTLKVRTCTQEKVSR